MAIVTARLKVKGKNYEIKVDLDEALKLKQGSGDITSALQSPGIYHDVDKGTSVSDSDMKDAFSSTDLYDVAKQIIIKGEVQKTQEFRDAKKEEKIKQVVNLILKNASDQNGNPFTESRILSAIDQAHYSFDSRPAEQQMKDLVDKLKSVIPIKIEVKKIKLTIPAQYTGQVYGLINDYKEKEEWLSNGNLETIISIPAGLQVDFYEKLNNVSHGAILSEELKE
jgi:ribosome maturation protein SDO1